MEKIDIFGGMLRPSARSATREMRFIVLSLDQYLKVSRSEVRSSLFAILQLHFLDERLFNS